MAEINIVIVCVEDTAVYPLGFLLVYFLGSACQRTFAFTSILGCFLLYRLLGDSRLARRTKQWGCIPERF